MLFALLRTLGLFLRALRRGGRSFRFSDIPGIPVRGEREELEIDLQNLLARFVLEYVGEFDQELLDELLSRGKFCWVRRQGDADDFPHLQGLLEQSLFGLVEHLSVEGLDRVARQRGADTDDAFL